MNPPPLTPINVSCLSGIRPHLLDDHAKYREMIILISVVASLLVTLCHSQPCEDVDSTICQDMFSLKSDMCSSACFSSSLCPRTCGKCPLKCYECHEVDSPDLCNTTTQCPSVDHFCITTQSFDDDFKDIFKLGCALNSICTEHLSPVFGRRDKIPTEQIQLSGSCCSTDFCNRNTLNISTTMQTSTPVTTTSHSVVPPVTSGPDVPSGLCHDVDADICNRLDAHFPDMCAIDCIANEVCPRKCGKCISCYQCSHVTNPESCTQKTICDIGQQCLSVETISASFEPGYKLGCMDNALCSTFGHAAPGTFGKRQGFELYVHGGCCKEELCNHHALQPTTTVPSTPSTTTVPSTTSITTVPSTTSATVVPPINNATTKMAPSATSTKMIPSANSTKIIPSANSTNIAPTATSTKMVPSATSTIIVPSVNSTKMVPSATSTIKVPLAASTNMVPSATSTKVAPSATSTIMVASETSTKVAPSATSTIMVPSATSTKMAPSATSTIMVPSATSKTIVPSINSATTVSSTTSTKMVLPTTSTIPSTTAGTTTVQSTTTRTTSVRSTETTTQQAASTAASTTLFPCKDYDKSGYCQQFVPLICNTADQMSKKFAIANCALSCNLCNDFYAAVASGDVVISP